jgi:hypothetical protein
MTNQKQNATNLISSLRQNSSIELARVFKSDDNKYWSVSGWFNDLYFSVYFTEFNNKFSTEFSSTTKCKEDISILLLKHYLI